jgi:hypothetical protein
LLQNFGLDLTSMSSSLTSADSISHFSAAAQALSVVPFARLDKKRCFTDATNTSAHNDVITVVETADASKRRALQPAESPANGPCLSASVDTAPATPGVIAVPPELDEDSDSDDSAADLEFPLVAAFDDDPSLAPTDDTVVVNRFSKTGRRARKVLHFKCPLKGCVEVLKSCNAVRSHVDRVHRDVYYARRSLDPMLLALVRTTRLGCSLLMA